MVHARRSSVQWLIVFVPVVERRVCCGADSGHRQADRGRDQQHLRSLVQHRIESQIALTLQILSQNLAFPFLLVVSSKCNRWCLQDAIGSPPARSW